MATPKPIAESMSDPLTPNFPFQGHLTMIGCGKLGSALLERWLKFGLKADQITICKPNPFAKDNPLSKLNWVQEIDQLPFFDNHQAHDLKHIYIIAVKPQQFPTLLPKLAKFNQQGNLFISLAAGITIDFMQSQLGDNCHIIRTMANTPALIGEGVIATFSNKFTSKAEIAATEAMLAFNGLVIALEDEAEMNSISALSGSGPAYVFALIEAMSLAGIGLGLKADIAEKLATATIVGAGKLATISALPPATLRQNVSSPKGITVAGLEHLLNPDTGLVPLMDKTMRAAYLRAIELGKLN